MFISIRHVNFQYPHTKELTIEDFSLNINQGEVISILGNSGSGKSTVLRIIAGLEIPLSGSITIGDKVVVDKHTFIPPEKREVGMVFQDYALFPHMTVEKNIQFGLKGLSKKQKQMRTEDMLSLVDMSNFKKRYPYELSGGQQQRIALARALAPAPSLLIFDEPFSNLDAEIQIKIRDELAEILKKARITSIFVTHDQSDARALANRIVYIEEGKITEVVQNKQ
jgi:iron(III) transport system ATP-binding protein